MGFFFPYKLPFRLWIVQSKNTRQPFTLGQKALQNQWIAFGCLTYNRLTATFWR